MLTNKMYLQKPLIYNTTKYLNKNVTTFDRYTKIKNQWNIDEYILIGYMLFLLKFRHF